MQVPTPIPNPNPKPEALSKLYSQTPPQIGIRTTGASLNQNSKPSRNLNPAPACERLRAGPALPTSFTSDPDLPQNCAFDPAVPGNRKPPPTPHLQQHPLALSPHLHCEPRTPFPCRPPPPPGSCDHRTQHLRLRLRGPEAAPQAEHDKWPRAAQRLAEEVTPRGEVEALCECGQWGRDQERCGGSGGSGRGVGEAAWVHGRSCGWRRLLHVCMRRPLPASERRGPGLRGLRSESQGVDSGAGDPFTLSAVGLQVGEWAEKETRLCGLTAGSAASQRTGTSHPLPFPPRP